MKTLLTLLFCSLCSLPVQAAVTLAVSQQSGPAVQGRAGQLAGRLGSKLGTTVTVRALADSAQVEEWLNRLATADLALLESAYVASRPGRFIVLGDAGHGTTLVGRQGIGGDLPQTAARLLGDVARLPAPPPPGERRAAAAQVPPTAGKVSFSPSKSVNEDRYFVTYVYQEKLGRNPDPERLEFWTGQLQSGALGKRELFDKACRPEQQGCNFR